MDSPCDSPQTKKRKLGDRKQRVVLNLEDRYRVIERNEKGESARAIADRLGVGRTQILNILHDKESIKQRFENGESLTRKISKAKKSPNEELNELVWLWYCHCLENKFPVNGPMIQEKAMEISMRLNLPDFMAWRGWLQRFKERRNIHEKVLQGERGEVDMNVVNDWTKRLPSLCEGYASRDIFNCDETGLYWRALPSRGLVQKGKDPAGIKTFKDRVTLLLCCSAEG